MSIKDFVQVMSTAVNSARGKISDIPKILLAYTSPSRPGMSARSITTKVINRLSEAGISAEENSDGTQNVTAHLARLIVDEVVNAIKYDSKVQIAIPVGNIKITGTGGNAGGPVVIQGFNTNIVSAYGIVM